MTFPLLAVAVFGAAAGAVAVAQLTRQFLLAALAASAIILCLHGVVYFDYTMDDSYITFRYAQNLSDGHGLVWNPGEVVEGYSNFLWVVLLALSHRAGADLITTGTWLGLALGVVTAGFTYLVTRDIVGDDDWGRWAGVAAALLLTACGTFAMWSTAGLEAPLLTALAMCAVWLHLRERDGSRLPLSGAVWGIAALTRPDAPLLFGVSLAFKAVESYMRVRAGDRTWQREARDVALYIALFAAVFAPYFVWRYARYDHLFPNTYYAKVGTGFDQFDRGGRYVLNFAQDYAAWLLLLAPLAFAIHPRRWPVLYPATLCGAWLLMVAMEGGDFAVWSRLLAPATSLLYASVAAAAAIIVRNAAAGRRLAGYGLAFAGAGLLAYTLWSSQFGTLDAQVFMTERQATRDRVDIGIWLRENVPDDTVVAVVAAGAIPYESQLPSIDMLGLSDEHIAHRDISVGRFAAGHEKYDSLYVLDRQPDIIVLFGSLESRPWSREDYEAASVLAIPIPAVSDMVGQPRLWERYEPRAVELREGEWANFLVRKDAAALLALTQPPPAP